MRLKRKYENFIIVKIFTNVNNNYTEFMDNENLKTKVRKTKKTITKRIKNLKLTIIDYKKNNKVRLISNFS